MFGSFCEWFSLTQNYIITTAAPSGPVKIIAKDFLCLVLTTEHTHNHNRTQPRLGVAYGCARWPSTCWASATAAGMAARGGAEQTRNMGCKAENEEVSAKTDGNIETYTLIIHFEKL